MGVVQGEVQEVQGGCCAYIGRASGRVRACGEGTPRASRPFRITGQDEMVMAARVVVRVAVVRLRASRSRGGAEGFVPLSDGEGAGEDEGGGAACDT